MAVKARPIKRALVSVSNKDGLIDFCSLLVKKYGVEIVSTGGTFDALQKAKIKCTEVSELTNFPEIMDGR